MTQPAAADRHAPRLQQALERELRPDETVLWHGWQLGRTEWRAFALYLFAIPWTGFALMWTALAAAGTAQMGDNGPGWIAWAFPLFGVPFIVVGLAMLAAPFLPLLQRGRVLYVVTDQRVLKLSAGRALMAKTVPADRIGLTERREGSDGSGTLRIAIGIGTDSDGDPRTEFLDVGVVADVMGAQAAVDRIAAPHRARSPRSASAGAASS